LAVADTGHAVACHFSDRVEGTPEQRQAAGTGRPTAVGQATETAQDAAAPPALVDTNGEIA
jgi:hypothetical protein